MTKFSLCVAAVAALCATAAMAQEQADARPDPAGLKDILSEMPGAKFVTGVSYYDMSGNGQEEALVSMEENCFEGSCEWRLFAETDNGWQAVGGGMSRKVFFEPTEGAGAVLNVDDITWAYSGGQAIYMWGDLLQGLTPAEAVNEEYTLVGATSEYDQTERMRLEKFSLDLNADGSPERVFLVGGLFYKVGQWGTPYLIYDANDELIMSGVSTDSPRIFPKSEKTGSLVVDVVPAGMLVSEIK